MRVLVTGAEGQLGHDVLASLAGRHQAIGVGRREMDLTDLASIPLVMRRLSPDCIVHCGAYTKVDLAEEQRELCQLVNGQATEVIARTAQELSAPLIYLSTDYVFDGTQVAPYEVDDETNPINFYGQSKLYGERAVRANQAHHHIVRISWVFGAQGDNFVKTMLRLGREKKELRVVSDQIGSPSYTTDVASLLSTMVGSDRYGTYHATNEGYCSWFEFAREIFSQTGREVKISPISSDQYPTRARRPRNSRLSKASLDRNSFPRLPPWRDALRRHLVDVGEVAP